MSESDARKKPDSPPGQDKGKMEAAGAVAASSVDEQVAAANAAAAEADELRKGAAKGSDEWAAADAKKAEADALGQAAENARANADRDKRAAARAGLPAD